MLFRVLASFHYRNPPISLINIIVHFLYLTEAADYYRQPVSFTIYQQVITHLATTPLVQMATKPDIQAALTNAMPSQERTTVKVNDFSGLDAKDSINWLKTFERATLTNNGPLKPEK